MDIFHKTSLKRKGSLLVLLSLILFHLINNYIWCSNDWITLEDDMTVHLRSHLTVYYELQKIISQPLNLLPNINNFLKIFSGNLGLQSHLYPPLFYLTSATTNTLFNNSAILITRLCNILYFSLLLISVYLIGKEMAGVSFGLLSAIFLSFYPAIFGMSRLYTLDFPLACVTASAMYFLIKTEYFTNSKKSLIFGIALGLGILIKAQIIMFIFGPFFYVSIRGYLKGRMGDRPLIINNLSYSLLLAAAFSSLWWMPNLNNLIPIFFTQARVSPGNISSSPWIGGVMNLKYFSLDWLLTYMYFIVNNISPVLFLVFLLGIFSIFRAKLKHKVVVLIWLFAAYIIFTFFPVKKDRFFLPALPALALISSCFIYNIRQRVIKGILITLLCLFALIQFFYLSYFQTRNELTGRNSIFYLTTPMEHPQICGYDLPKGNFYECVYYRPRGRDIKQMGYNLLYSIGQAPGSNKDIYVNFLTDKHRNGNILFGVMYILKSNDPRIHTVAREDLTLGEKFDNTKGYDYVVSIKDTIALKGISEDDIVSDSLKGILDSSNFKGSYVLLNKWYFSFDHCLIMLFKKADIS